MSLALEMTSVCVVRLLIHTGTAPFLDQPTIAVPHVFAGTMRVVFKIKVLPLGEYDSLNAELKKTQKDLEVMTVTDKKAKKEAAANFEAFNEAKQHKIAAEERNTAAMKKISDLEAKIMAMENHMAEAKALAASSINKMDDGLLRGRAVANERPATKKDSQAAAQKEKGGDTAKTADDMLVAATGGGEAGEDSAAKKKQEENIKKVATKRGLRR